MNQKEGKTGIPAVKICGLTSPREADCLNQYKPEYAGMVLFCEKSRRNISPPQAEIIMERLAPEIRRVAVVVSPSIEQAHTIQRMGFQYIQIHGNLDPEVLEEIHLPIFRAFSASSLEHLKNDSLQELSKDKKIAGYVFDSQEPGSGRTFDWRMLETIDRGGKELILAGGLTPENVKRAIEAVRPDVVDVSSGVEYTDENKQGRHRGKDPEKIRDFICQVRSMAEYE